MDMNERAMVEVGEAALRHQRPSVLYRPALVFRDGAWMAILGDDPHQHFGAQGPTPAAAMENFDHLFYLAAVPAAAEAKPAASPAIDITPDVILAAIKAPIPTPPRGSPMLGPSALIDYAQDMIAKRVNELLTR